MEVVIAVQSGLLVNALRIMQRRRVSTHRGRGHDKKKILILPFSLLAF